MVTLVLRGYSVAWERGLVCTDGSRSTLQATSVSRQHKKEHLWGYFCLRRTGSQVPQLLFHVTFLRLKGHRQAGEADREMPAGGYGSQADGTGNQCER